MKTLSFIILFLTQIYAQTPFEVTVGTTGCENLSDAKQTTDGGYVMCGGIQVSANQPADMYIVKLDSAGILQWTRKVGGGDLDNGNSIIQTTDGNYVIAGETKSYGVGQANMYIVKLNSGGNVIWNKTVGGTFFDYATCIIQSTDGSYVACGRTESFAEALNMFIVKLDTSGSLVWSKSIGGSGGDWANSIIQTSDGGYALAGVCSSFGAGHYDMFIVKLGTNGSLQWSKTVGMPWYEYATSIIRTTDGGYTVTGRALHQGANYDVFIARLDSGGNVQWSKSYDYQNDNLGHRITQTSDDGFVIAGDTQFGQYYGCLIKIDSAGSFQWSKSILCHGSNIIATSDGGYAAAGSTDLVGAGCNDFCLVKFDVNWNTCQSIGQPVFTSVNEGTSTSPVPGIISVTPVITTPTPPDGTEGIITNICNTVGVTNQGNKIPGHYNLSQNYPNPFNPSTTIKFSLPKSSFVKLTVYDVTGKEIQTLVKEQLEAGSYEKTFDASALSSGMYFYKLTAGDYSEVKKMVLIK